MSPCPCLQPFPSSSTPPSIRLSPHFPPIRPFTCHTPLLGVGLIIPHSSFFPPSLPLFSHDSLTHTPVAQHDISQSFSSPSFCSLLSSSYSASLHPPPFPPKKCFSLFFTLAQTYISTELSMFFSNSTFALFSCPCSGFPLRI